MKDSGMARRTVTGCRKLSNCAARTM
jgi:hypothetical protein